MSWREVTDEKSPWEFVRQLVPRPGLFLQTPSWASFQQRFPKNVLTLAWSDQNSQTGLAQLIRSPLPLKRSYWFVPKGPLWAAGVGQTEQVEAMAELLSLTRKSGALFVRIEPTATIPNPKSQIPIKSPDVNPRATTVVDLSPPFETILARMHAKTRYNIRLAERKGLTFRWGGLAEFDNFWSLLQETSQREHFRPHSASHYRVMLEMFGNQPLTTPELACRLGLVEYQGEVLAASLVVIFNRQATYLHGASSRRQRELMAPNLLHGAAMRQLKSAGCLTYDFWGVQPTDGSLPSWAGLTRFKLGFGGQRLESPGTFDYPMSAAGYTAYRCLRRLRRAMS